MSSLPDARERVGLPLHTLTASAWGSRFSLRADEQLLNHLASALPNGSTLTAGQDRVDRNWAIERSPDGQLCAYTDGKQVCATTSEDEMVRLVVDDIELWIAETAPDFVFVHAGVVVHRGRAIVVPGRSLSGKSTLIAALVRAGADYYSDEFAPIDHAGRVHAYPRAIRVRPNSPATAWVSSLEADPATLDQVAVCMVAEVAHHHGARMDTATVSSAAGLMALLRNTVCAATRPLESLAALTHAVRDAHCIHGVRGEAEDAAADLLSQLEQL